MSPCIRGCGRSFVRSLAVLGLGALVLSGCAGPARALQPVEARGQLFDGLGTHHFEVTTSSPEAQRYFDQGLAWMYAFNHDEAIRSFKETARRDPGCAMAWWGVALANGPHINNPAMSPQQSQAAWAALQEAERLKDGASPREKALIKALAARYANPAPADRGSLDEAYARAMGSVWNAWSGDADVGTLYAEALMDLRPWNLWTKAGLALPGTEAITSTLEEVLRIDPNHPGANHLYVHAVEASSRPERADGSADRLRTMMPASGHMTHMPSHIDVVTGRWREAAVQNEAAIAADRAYTQRSPRQGFYRIYMAHNHHMLAFASMMEGRSQVAIDAARQIGESIPEAALKEQAAVLDIYVSARFDPLKRFGRWEALLEEPRPPEYLPITTSLWRFHRALAHAALGQLPAAEQEQALFREAVARVPADARAAINKAHDVLQVAEHVLVGELALARGDLIASAEALRKGVAAEDALIYMEPPEWPQPVRHTLGAVLLRDHRYTEAERVYREDLARWRENGWSLLGLAEALKNQARPDEAKVVEARMEKAWARADIPLVSSCLCVPGADAPGASGASRGK